MEIYLITFVSSFLLCLVAERRIKKAKRARGMYPLYVEEGKNKDRGAIILLFLSVLIVAIMAGFRDNLVGSDTISYTTYYIEYGSKFQSLKDFNDFFVVYEPGFNLFSYVIGIIFNHNSHWFLFWCAMVIYGFTMKAFYFYRHNCSISMAWLFFLMLNCTEALNITRNYMALALAAYAFTFVFRKDIKRFLVWTVIAMSFHVSAVFNILLYFIYKGLRTFNTWWYKTLVVIVTLVVGLLCSYIFQALSSFSFIGEKAAAYNITEFSLQLNPLLIRLPFLILVLLNKNSFSKIHLIHDDGYCDERDVFGEFCVLLLIIELFMSQLRGFSETLYRLVTYAAVLKYVSYSTVLDTPPLIANRIVKRVIAYIFIGIVFWYWVAKLNSGWLLPYSSDILGITPFIIRE